MSWSVTIFSIKGHRLLVVNVDYLFFCDVSDNDTPSKEVFGRNIGVLLSVHLVNAYLP